MNEINDYLYDLERDKLNNLKVKKNNKMQKNFQLTIDNVKYLARLKYKTGLKYSELINLILDDYRKNNFIK